MDTKKLVWIGTIVGSYAGGYIPTLWGAGFLSFSSIFFSAVGAIIGIYIAWKISQYY